MIRRYLFCDWRNPSPVVCKMGDTLFGVGPYGRLLPDGHNNSVGGTCYDITHVTVGFVGGHRNRSKTTVSS